MPLEKFETTISGSEQPQTLILDCAANGISSQALYPWKHGLYILNRRLGVPQNQLGQFGENKKFLPMPGIKT
jgi:hypothetical protein